MTNKNDCSPIGAFLPQDNCSCDYIPPPVKKLLIRKNKKGLLKVQVNGTGKWIPCEYNKENNTITFLH